MDINNIKLIDQRLAHLSSSITKCKAQSTAAENRLADTIIKLEIERIKEIHAIKKDLANYEPLSRYIKLAALHTWSVSKYLILISNS